MYLCYMVGRFWSFLAQARLFYRKTGLDLQFAAFLSVRNSGRLHLGNYDDEEPHSTLHGGPAPGCSILPSRYKNILLRYGFKPVSEATDEEIARAAKKAAKEVCNAYGETAPRCYDGGGSFSWRLWRTVARNSAKGGTTVRIWSMRVGNIRSVRSTTLEFDDLTAFVGANESGKSAFLQALLVFQGRQEDEEGFYSRDTSRDIRIAVTFTGLPGEVRERFARYLRGGDLEVTRVCRHNSDGAAAGSSLRGTYRRNPAFDAVHGAHDPVAALDEYNKLRGIPEYSYLPRRAAGAAARRALDEWEDANPGKCDRLDDDGSSFFGFGEAAAGNLGRFIKILYVSAAREDYGGGGRPGPPRLLEAILRDMVGEGDRGQYLQRDMVGEGDRGQYLQRDMDAAYDRAPFAGGPTGMRQMDDDISAVLGTLARGARVEHGGMLAPGLKMLSTTIRLAEDGYTTTADRVGAGLQRAFTIAMTGHMHGNQSGAGPTIVLAIEEPELHQHPARARHIAGLLSSISRTVFAGVAKDVQVAYTTHSPHFVGADRMGQIRLVRKEGGEEGMPGETRVRSAGMDKIQGRLAGAGAARRAGPGWLERDFDRILTPLMNEGFFARTAVLVEGDSDRIAIMKTTEILGTPLDEMGVAVIPCGSKSGLLGPLAMFAELYMRTYPMLDRDGDAGKGEAQRPPPLAGRARRQRRLPGRHRRRVFLPQECPRGGAAFGHERKAVRQIGRRVQEGVLTGTRDLKKPLVTHLLMREMEERGIRPVTLGRSAGDPGVSRGGL